MRKIAAAFTLMVLVGCGKNDRSTAPTPVTVPPVTLPRTQSGTYTGLMTVTLSAGVLNGVTGTTTVTHDGGPTMTIGNLRLTHPAGLDTTYGMGTVTLSGDTYRGTGSYTSGGCGLIVVTMAARFAGDLMNLQATLTPARCDPSDVRGEIRR